jgi:hypothetical protein
MPISVLDASAWEPNRGHWAKQRDCCHWSPGWLKSHPTSKVDLPIASCFEGETLAAGL